MRDLLVLGSGRSGTSTLTGCLASAGWWTGDDAHPPRESNPRGFFESASINQLHERWLRAASPVERDLGSGCLWLLGRSAPLRSPLPARHRAELEAAVHRRPFAIKDPRLVWTWPRWEQTFGPLGKLVIFRDPACFATSVLLECRRQPYLRGVAMSRERALDLWCRQNEALLEAAEDASWHFLSYESLLSAEGFAGLESFVGAPVDRGFVDPRLQRSEPGPTLTEAARALHRRLLERAAEDTARAGSRLPAQPGPPAEAFEPLGPQDAPEPRISVLISSYDRREVLLRSLTEWDRLAPAAPPHELIVSVDDASDGVEEEIRRRAWRMPLRLLTGPRCSLARARNRCWRLARAPLLLIVNDDTRPQEGLLRAHLDAHDPDASTPRAVLGRFDAEPRHLRTLLGPVVEHSDLGFPYRGMHDGARYGWEKFWTCNLSLPRAAVDAVGGFDEGYEGYGCEDSDLGVRLGLPVHFVAEARARHDHAPGIDGLRRRQIALARANVRFFARHPHLVEDASWAWSRQGDLAHWRRERERTRAAAATAERAARGLAGIDVDALREVDAGRELQDLARVLGRCLRTANRHWWAQGVVAGLEALEASPVDAIGPAERPLGKSPISLRTREPRRWLAWPDYRQDEELQSLFALVASESPRPALCLRWDPEVDPPKAELEASLRRAYARHFREDEDLELLLVDDPLADEDWGRLGEAVEAWICLDSSHRAPRRPRLDALRCPRREPAPAI